MAGGVLTASPSFITIFLTSTTRPAAAGGSAAISSHLPRLTKHPCRVGMRGSPGASRMSLSGAPERLSRANYRGDTNTEHGTNVVLVWVSWTGPGPLLPGGLEDPSKMASSYSRAGTCIRFAVSQ